MTDFRYGQDIPVFRRTLGRFALLLWGLLFCAGAYAQNGRITLDVRNVTLEEAMTRIERQGEYSFLYNKTLIDVTQVINSGRKTKPARLRPPIGSCSKPERTSAIRCATGRSSSACAPQQRRSRPSRRRRMPSPAGFRTRTAHRSSA